MKPMTPALEAQLKNASAIKALPTVVADWNLNRYHDTNVGNIPDEQDAAYDIELFPIESLVKPMRPHKGINKARVGQSVVSREYFDDNDLDRNEPTLDAEARFYVADQDDLYKYWTSPKPAVGGIIPKVTLAEFPEGDDDGEYPPLAAYDGLTSARPFVEYLNNDTGAVEAVPANKVVIKLENTWASPDSFKVLITRESGTEVTIQGTSFVGWEASGELEMYWNGLAWTASGNRVDDPATGLPKYDKISKIQLWVDTLKGGYGTDGNPTQKVSTDGVVSNTDGSDSFLDVIEIGAHLEADLSEWVIDTNDAFDMSEISHLYPIGTITTNQGSVTLSNLYESAGETVLGLFSAENTDPNIPWAPYIDKNVELFLDYTFYDHDDNVTGTSHQFSMFVDSWDGQANENVTVEASDASKFFNEITVPPVMWEELKVPEIIWRLLDTVGFTGFVIDRHDHNVTEHTIPVFYTTGEESLWEVLDELAKASQTAIFFDADGTLRVKTRDYALSASDAPVWTLQSYDDATQKANIETLEQTSEFEPNSVKVIYKKTNWSKYNKGLPSMQRMWEPEDENVVLRGTPLRRTLEVDADNLFIGADDVKVWPYEGIVNVGGELIRYEGKHYVYYDKDNVRQTTIVKSNAERRSVQRKLAGYRRKSHFTGGLHITERGLWNSEPHRHPVDIEGYSVRQMFVNNGTVNVNNDAPGFRHLKQDSKAELRPGKRFKDKGDWLLATRGQPDDMPFFHYGTKFRFVRDKSRTTQCAGMVIHNGGNKEDGYYIELSLSKNITAKKRQASGELVLFARSDGKNTRLASQDLAVGENIDYELDVTFSSPSGPHILQVFVNGKEFIRVSVEGATRVAANGRFGFFARGRTRARYEYLYAIRRGPKELPTDFSYLDKIERAYMGDTWMREWVFNWKSYRKRVKKKWRRARRRHNRYFFDDFGPYVHEVREYDVKFDPVPALHSRLYLTNDWSNVCLEYTATPVGAKFILANTARHNTVIHGEDKLSYAGTNSAINQILTVFGRPLIMGDDEEVLAENTDQIRARGKIESDLTSPWIQSKAMARDLADWIRDNWTYGNENITVNIFGNPLLQVGDVVRVEYPEKHISGDFFVVGIRNSFEAGISTSLDLRRRI